MNNKLLIDKIYPIGSIYMSINSTNPSSIFGGTWERIAKGRTLVGVDENDIDFYQSQIQEGEKKHTLTANEIPNFVFTVNHTAYGDEGFSGITNVTHTLLTNQGGQSNINYEGAKGEAQGYRDKYEFGGGASHNNLQPYYTCFIFVRTA